MGFIYYLLEETIRFGDSKPIMIVIGGICSIAIGLINEYPSFYNLKMYQMSAIGTLIVLAIEYISGMILNVWLHMNVWDYTGIWGNINGQICLPYSLPWFFICVPLAIWCDDYLRWKLFGEEKIDSLLIYFYRFFTLR